MDGILIRVVGEIFRILPLALGTWEHSLDTSFAMCFWALSQIKRIGYFF